HQRRHDQQSDHDGKDAPEENCVASRGGRLRASRLVGRIQGCGRWPLGHGDGLAHLGVGTNRPVGRNRSVRISTMNDTITACDGATQIGAWASRRLRKIAAAIEPPRLPMPPTTTTMKAFRTQFSPMVWLTATSGPNSTPLAAAIAAPIANVAVCTHGTGMPMA